MEVVNLSCLWLLDLICELEMSLASLLRGNNLGVIHVNLVNTIVELSAIQLSEDMLSEFIVGLEVSRFMLSDERVDLGVNGNIELHQG